MTLSSKELMLVETRPIFSIRTTDTLLNFILTIELFIRFLTCPCKIKFVKNFFNVVDFLSLIVIWFAKSFEFIPEMAIDVDFAPVAKFVGMMYSLRVFRIFRLAQHHPSMQILVLSVRSNCSELFFSLLAFNCFSLAFAGLIWMAEINSEEFENYCIAIWWAMITMTTVGYGDQTPTNWLGYMVGAACAIVGIMIIAIPVAITSSSFYEFYRFNKFRIWQQSKTRDRLMQTNQVTPAEMKDIQKVQTNISK